MAGLRSFHSTHLTTFIDSFAQVGPVKFGQFSCSRRGFRSLTRATGVLAPSMPDLQDKCGRRQVFSIATIASWISFNQTLMSFAAETVKGFLPVSDNKDGYSFVYPFGWQEVIVEGKDRVFKDVIEPLESVSINLFPTSRKDLHELGSAQEVAEALIKRAFAPSSQKTKLVEATEHDIEGKTYYRFEFVVQAPNYTRHALSAICIGNGMKLLEAPSMSLNFAGVVIYFISAIWSITRASNAKPCDGFWFPQLLPSLDPCLELL